MNHSWKGNVRELENVLERLMNRCTEDVITVDLLPEEFLKSDMESNGDKPYLIKTYEEAEKEILVNALNYFEGNISQAAKSLKISRNTLYNKISKYQMMV